jgi:allophanate hydrolase subunit 2
MADLFEADAWTRLVSADFAIHAASDRMGYRLEGPPLTLRDRTPLLSEGTSMGTVQVPPDGRAIVLMADRQATGGYAKIASVAGVDLPALAQRNPGEVLRFTPIELEHARALLARREAAFQRLDMQLGRLRAALRDAASPPDR